MCKYSFFTDRKGGNRLAEEVREKPKLPGNERQIAKRR